MKNRSYLFLSFISFLLLSFVLFFHFRIIWMPATCLLLGILARIIFKGRSLEVFSFFIPVLPAFAILENKGFPLHYLLLPLFFLVGITAGEFAAGKGRSSWPLPELPRGYVPFLLLLGISFLFLLLRWSNLTLSPLAFLHDTPVAPTGQRLSFGIILPAVEFALFALSPFYYLLLRRADDPRRILVAFLCGQSLSIVWSFIQRWQGTGARGFLISGLASDATAFGFLCALAILMAWYLHARCAEKRLGFLFTVVSLAGILNSSTRVGLFAIVAAVLLFTFSSRKRILFKIAVAALLLMASLLYVRFMGKTELKFLSRIGNTIKLVDRSLESRALTPRTFKRILAKRGVLWGYSLESLRKFTLSGLGPGNYVFWVMTAHSDDFFHHLPANQYFFISSSTGLIGLAAFLLFCFGLFRHKKWPEKWLLGIFLFLLIFNDYLWFSEIFLEFWLFCSLGESAVEKPLVRSKNTLIVFISALLVFVLFNVLKFSDLHPKNWARGNLTAYDYGLYNQENDGGRIFRWTKERAGMYIYLDRQGHSVGYNLVCGAPLSRLSEKKQTVDIYWRGRFLKSAVFRDNGQYPVQIEDHEHGEGFLEFRVRPTFNLKRIGLGAETRELGVQVSGTGI